MMSTGEMGTPTKTTKNSTSQEQTSTSTSPAHPEWAATVQGFYNSGTTSVPPGYFHAAIASSPQGQPYMWGHQPFLPPYPTPHPPYVAMYSHGAMYTHPPMPAGVHPYGTYAMSTAGGSAEKTSGTVPACAESSEAKEQSSLRSSKGNIGSHSMFTEKVNESGKQTMASRNEVVSPSGESGTEGSNEGSDDNSQNGSHSGQKMQFDQGYAKADEAQNDNTNSSPTMAIAAIPLPATSGMVVVPTTNLNIGMDYWCGSTPRKNATMRGKLPVSSQTTAIAPAALNMAFMAPRDTIPPDIWLQDERELKRQRRKQSNRESARRSRLRKQAECEELARRVETLTSENMALRSELEHMREDNEKLRSENSSMAEQLNAAMDQEKLN